MQKNKNTRKKVAIIISVILLCIMVFIIGMMNTQTKKKEILKKQKLLEQTGANTANESIANMPKLSQGMVPVKWNGTNWVITTVQDTEWYDYQNKQWANVMLQDELTYDENKNVTSSGSMYVWIPRYAYQITHGYHTNEVGEIQTVFLQGNSNKTAYTKEANREITNTTMGQDQWLVPTAFTYEGQELEGIWVAKYQARSNGNGGNQITERIRIKNDKTQWKNIPINSVFSLCMEMNTGKNEYGLSSDDTRVDPHLMKNSEWAAMAYLSHSRIGIHQQIVDTATSTTGNETGIYEVAGQLEFTATYVNNANNNVNAYGDVLVNAATKYIDILKMGTSDTEMNNYHMTSQDYGNAIYEVSSGIGNMAWYEGRSNFPATTTPFFIRGDASGIFSFNATNGQAGNISFRPVIIVKGIEENEIKIDAVSKVATNEPVTVKISYGDTNLTNEDQYQYKINQTGWQTGQKNQEVVVNENGTVVYARIYNGSETVKQVSYEVNNIDKTAPNAFSISKENISNIHDIGFSIQNVVAQDNQSGVKKYDYIVKEGDKETVFSQPEIEGLVHNTSYEIFVRAYDYAGNAKDSNHIQMKTGDVLQKPKLTQGMIPVKWEGNQWIETTVDDEQWYNYEEKKWANVKLEDGSMMVWIPKYAYKITSGYHENTNAGEIEIVLLNGTKAIDRKEGILPISQKKGSGNWNLPNAFMYGDTQMEGYWVAKYEASKRTDDLPQFIAKADTWRSITIKDSYAKSVAMKSAGNPYGLSTEITKADPHLMKNTEWGAVTYLAQSRYGKQTEVIYNGLYKTGSVQSSEQYPSNEGQASSTTGNIYGIYDMSGGVREYVAGSIDPENEIVQAEEKHSDVYPIQGSNSSLLNYYHSYQHHFGDAVYETSNANVAWYGKSSAFPYGSYSWFTRGGLTNNGGIFKYEATNGNADATIGFRTAIMVPQQKTGQIDAPRISYEIAENKRSAKVTIFYDSQMATKKQYRIGNGPLQDYTGPFVVEDNVEIYAENTDGQTTANTSKTITGVWTIKIPEIVPTYGIKNTKLTIEIHYDENATKKQYKIEDGSWIDYTGPIDILLNHVTIYAQNENAAGETASSSYTSMGIIPEGAIEITTPEELNLVRNDPAQKYRLMNDIDLSGYESWVPIPNFTGEFYGSDYAIKNLTITATSGNLNGLFATLENDTKVINLKLENVNINGGGYNGALVGQITGNNVEIDGVSANGTIVGKSYTGGLIGIIGTSTNINVKNSWTNCEVTGQDYTGGLIGRFSGNGSIINCYTIGNIQGYNNSKYNYVGGLIGSNTGEINQCYATGNITGKQYVGGLIGSNSGGINRCYATGSVIGTGAVVGTGNNARSITYAGGLIGNNSGVINQCYATGNVKGTNYIGGLIGYNNKAINQCYAMGKMESIGYHDNQQAFIGYNAGSGATITNGYYITEGSKIATNNYGTEIDTFSNGVKQTMYQGFDFQEIWEMQQGVTTPYLKGMKIPDSVYVRNNTDKYQGEGEGTQENPYQIKTVEDLKNVEKSPGVYYKIMNDLDLSGEEDWTPIQGFFGKINGQNYKIKNLTINDTSRSKNGLFATLENNAKIMNLKLENVNVNGGTYTGALIGDITGNNVEIDGVSVNGTIEGKSNTGGLIGRTDTNMNTNVKNSWTNCEITGQDDTGGLIGSFSGSGSIVNCYATGNVQGFLSSRYTYSNIGGLIGSNNGEISQCYTTGNVKGKKCIGGLVGSNGGGINGCYATGSIIGLGEVLGTGNNVRSESFTGGLIGSNNGEINQCYATGDVEGSNYIGGLIGYNSKAINQCYAMGKVDISKYSNTKYQQAFIGYNNTNTSITNGYYIAEGTKISINSYATEIDSFANGAKESTYQGFDFQEIWEIQEGVTTPYLKGMKIPDSVYFRNSTNKYQGEGEGTQENPYQIKTVEDLKNVEKSPGVHYKIMNDLDLSSEENWTPIQGFFGKMDGQNYKVKNLTITSASENQKGLFATLGNNAKVMNLKLENVNININSTDYVGALVGNVSGSNVEIDGVSANGTVTGRNYTGGLIGTTNTNMSTNVKNSWANCEVTGQDYTGGLIGSFSGNESIVNCYTTGNVKGREYVGGLIGSNSGRINQCYAMGNITGLGVRVGTGKYAYWYTYAGGLIGTNSGEINQCYATGDVTANARYVGGLSGSQTDKGTSSESYATGNVKGTEEYIAGLIGYNSGGINQCYAMGNVEATKSSKGALIGTNSGSKAVITNGYYITEGSKIPASSYGTEIDTFVNGAKQATYQGFDFQEIWEIQEGVTTPYLKNMVIPRSVYLSNH